MSAPLIRDITDTARWVAVYRADESARPDALFHDPLAGLLAGERGRAIAARAPRASAFAMVARTKLIDDLSSGCVREGCDRVVNLAAGFDTRPYRLALPDSLEWIEADLPAIIDEKERLLAAEQPRCRLRREKVDLASPQARAALLDRATEGATRALVISEGLLVYLEEGTVIALSRDLSTRPAIHWWIFELSSPFVLEWMNRKMGTLLANAPRRFAPPNGVAYFEALGWRVRDVRSLFREAGLMRRLPLFLRLFTIFPDPDPRNPGQARWSAVVRLER